jgi:PhzF family phenazine biosynthesis protein
MSVSVWCRCQPSLLLQALARQFNLSETTFILPASSAEATARVRIFTPSYEMPFAGHPTIGTSYVVRALKVHMNRFLYFS